MGGSNGFGQGGVYGTLGTPASTNIPGARAFASGWVDMDGNLWLFGGGYNDLFEYLPQFGQTWPLTATPFFSAAPGTYSSSQSVAISDTTPGAIIYYTTDGTSPGANSRLYSAAIPVVSTETIQAIAIAPGSSLSSVASASYTILQSLPTISLAIPTHHTQDLPFTVSTSSNSAGAIIYSVVSGPATVAANMVTLTGAAGTVVLQASQAASGTYIASTQTASFQVIGGSVWFGNWDPGTGLVQLSTFDLRGVEITNAKGYAGGGYGGTAQVNGLAFDASGNLWTTNINGVSELSPQGTPITSQAITAGGVNYPSGIAVDGAGQVWVANTYGTLTVLTNAGVAVSPAAGYRITTSQMGGTVVDISGNVWLTTGTTVIRLLGAAAPTVPLATAATSGAGVKP